MKKNKNMAKKIVKINEMQLRNLVAETIERIAEDTKAQRKKDPMNQWFKDADKLSRLRDMSNPTYDAERQKNIDKALKESGDTRRGSYMKGRTIGRKMAKGDTSTVGKDNLGNYPEMGELGMKDQYGYEMAAKNNGLFGNPFKADERLQDIQDRYERLKHDDKFFGDWDKHINGQLNEAQLRNMIAESVKKVLKENSEKLNNVYWELDEHLKKAIDLSSKLIELGSKEGNKKMMGYATTVQNALQTLCYEKLDKQEYDSSSIYPKNHWGGLAMSELYPDDTDK